MTRLVTLATTATVLLLAASDPGPLPVRWQEPANYTFEVTATVGDVPSRTWAIGVRDHIVVTQVARESDEIGWDPEAGHPSFTLADLVAEYNSALAEDPWCSDIHFDPATGAPSGIAVDWCSAPFDGGAFYTVDAFTPVGVTEP